MSSNVRRLERRHQAKKEKAVTPEQPQVSLTIDFADPTTPTRHFQRCHFSIQGVGNEVVMSVTDSLSFSTHFFRWELIAEVRAEAPRVELAVVVPS